MNDRSGILHCEIEYETSEIKTILKTKDPSKTEFTITDLQWKMTYDEYGEMIRQANGHHLLLQIQVC